MHPSWRIGKRDRVNRAWSPFPRITRERSQMPTVTEEACSFINHEESCASAKIFPKTWRLPSVDFADTTRARACTYTHTHNRYRPKSLANKRGARQLIRRRRRRGGARRVYFTLHTCTLARARDTCEQEQEQEYEERGWWRGRRREGVKRTWHVTPCLARLHLLPKPPRSPSVRQRVSPTLTPPPPLGGSLLIPLAPHPLPHRSALMSGKNKTASPTARTEFHPPLRRRTTACIGKKGSRESETGEGKRDSSVGRRGSKGLGGREKEGEREEL